VYRADYRETPFGANAMTSRAWLDPRTTMPLVAGFVD